MRFSIRYQLLLPWLALMLAVVGISIATGWASARRAHEQILTQRNAVLRTVTSVTFPANAQTLALMKSLAGADFLLCDLRREPLRDDEGRPLTTLEALPTSLPPPIESPPETLGILVRVGDREFHCTGTRLGGAVASGRIIYVFHPEELSRQAVRQAVQPSLIIGSVGGTVSILLIVAVTQRLTRRIQELERRTRLIAGGDFGPMPLPRRRDELRDLALSVNDMARKLADFRETVRTTERLRLLGQVSGGLAHQLRNGVAGARLAVQLYVRENDRAERDETLEVALRQLALVESYLKCFLDLGRVKEPRRTPSDLGDIVREVATLLGPRCRHAPIHMSLVPPLAWENPPSGTGSEIAITVDADAEQLHHLLLNLMTNAVEAAAPGGRVEVRWGRRPGSVFVEVVDSGPGPAPEVAARLFEPFVTGKAEGVGLGLATCRQIAEAHGGNVSWSRVPGGTCFRLELPDQADEGGSGGMKEDEGT